MRRTSGSSPLTRAHPFLLLFTLPLPFILTGIQACAGDLDGDGWSEADGDCDDDDPATYRFPASHRRYRRSAVRRDCRHWHIASRKASRFRPPRNQALLRSPGRHH